jgi:hypothetical protein
MAKVRNSIKMKQKISQFSLVLIVIAAVFSCDQGPELDKETSGSMKLRNSLRTRDVDRIEDPQQNSSAVQQLAKKSPPEILDALLSGQVSSQLSALELREAIGKLFVNSDISLSTADALSLFALLDDQGMVMVSGHLIECIVRNEGIYRAQEVYRQLPPGTTRLQAMGRLGSLMRGTVTTEEIFAFADTLEFPEERLRASQNNIDGETVQLINQNIDRASELLKRIESSEAREGAFDSIISSLDPSGKGDEIRNWLEGHRSLVSEETLHRAWGQLVANPAAKDSDIMAFWGLDGIPESVKENAMANIASWKMRSDPKSMISLIQGFEKEDQLRLVNKISIWIDPRISVQIGLGIGDIDVRDLYFERAARLFSSIGRTTKDNPFIEQISSQESVNALRAEIEQRLELVYQSEIEAAK